MCSGGFLSALHRGALVERVDQRQVCGREAPGPLHAEALLPAGWSRNRHDEGLWGTLLGAKVLQTWNECSGPLCICHLGEVAGPTVSADRGICCCVPHGGGLGSTGEASVGSMPSHRGGSWQEGPDSAPTFAVKMCKGMERGAMVPAGPFHLGECQLLPPRPAFGSALGPDPLYSRCPDRCGCSGLGIPLPPSSTGGDTQTLSCPCYLVGDGRQTVALASPSATWQGPRLGSASFIF